MGRYNRYYRPRRQGSVFSVFLIVIILAVAAGYAGTKYFVYPYLIDTKSASEEKNNKDTQTNTTTEGGVDAISSMPSVIIDQQDIKDANPATGEGIVNNQNPAVTPGTVVTGKGPFSVQFGSLSTKEAAEELSAQLTQKGIYSYVFESKGNYKVLGLPYADKEKANQAVSIVSAAASDAFVVDLSTLMN